MKIAWVEKENSRRLLLFFAGWGMDEKPFVNLCRPYFDFAVAYDYSDGSVAASLGEYEEVMIIAWSFGVIAADCFIREHPELPITTRIAVNGTLHPVDDRLGIPSEIFKGTLNGLSDTTLARFRRRMCGGTAAMGEFMKCAPHRTLESLRAELESILTLGTGGADWDAAYVSLSDRIIPPVNQLNEWKERGVVTHEIEGAHLPDFYDIVNKEIYNKGLVASRFGIASATYDENAPVQRAVARRLSELWREKAPGPLERVIEIGAGTGLFTDAYSEWLQAKELELWDLSCIREELPGCHRICDAEAEIRKLMPDSIDAIAGASTVQWFSSLPTFIRRCALVLRQGGWFVISTFGPRNFSELAPSRYPDAKCLEQWIEESGLEVVEIEEKIEVQTFPTPGDLLRHIKMTGVNALNPTRASAGVAVRVMRSSLRQLTYHTVILIARKIGHHE